jgi:hypothetical protein
MAGRSRESFLLHLCVEESIDLNVYLITLALERS